MNREDIIFLTLACLMVVLMYNAAMADEPYQPRCGHCLEGYELRDGICYPK